MHGIASHSKRPPKPSWQALLSRFALALAVLLAQQHAGLHWLSHAIDATQAAQKKDAHPASSDSCDACLALSAFGGAVASAGFEAPLLPAAYSPAAFAEPAAVSAARHHAYLSRAPPARG